VDEEADRRSRRVLRYIEILVVVLIAGLAAYLARQ
jgi:hypothetical protein